MKIHWSAATRFHDWKENDYAFPASLILRFYKAGLIGNLEWLQTGILKDKTEGFFGEGEALLRYLDFKPKRNDLYSISAGGRQPFEWKLTLGIFPYNKEERRVNGYNIMNLWFDEAILAKQGISDELYSLFKEMHRASNTEYAFIHPYDRWVELNDYFKGAYKKPVTFNPMFTGISWATFLGTGQLELFDWNKIDTIISDKILYKSRKELYIRITNNVVDVLENKFEEEMIELTNRFRASLK